MLGSEECYEFYEFTKNYQRFTYYPLGSRIQQINKDAKTIIDLGTGPGYLTQFFAENYPAKIQSVDINPVMHEIAKKVLNSSKEIMGEVEFSINDVHKLKFDDNYADLIVTYTCYHHYFDPVKALKECYRVLKPGGQLLIIDCQPVDNKTLTAISNKIPQYDYINFIKKAFDESFSQDDLKSHLKGAGIKNYHLSNLVYSYDEYMEHIDLLEEEDFSLETNLQPTLWICNITKE